MKQSYVQARVSPRAKALKIAGVQLICVALAALSWVLFGKWTAGMFTLIGGLALIVPTLLLAIYLYATLSNTSPKRLALQFCIGELAKLTVTALVLGLVMVKQPAALFPLLSGFGAAVIGTWCVPLFMPVD